MIKFKVKYSWKVKKININCEKVQKLRKYFPHGR